MSGISALRTTLIGTLYVCALACVQGQIRKHVRAWNTQCSGIADHQRLFNRRLSGLEGTKGAPGEVIVVKCAKDFMQLLNEFGNYVEIHNHLDLRGLSNTDFDLTRILNGRFAFRSLKGNCSDPFPSNLGISDPTIIEKRNNQCLIMLGGTDEHDVSDFDLMLTSIRENPATGDPLWIDNIYFKSTGRSKTATLYVGGGLIMTNVTMQGGDRKSRNGAVEAIDYAVHVQDSTFVDYLATDSPTFRCATKGTYCSFRTCNFSLLSSPDQSHHASQMIVGSANDATVAIEDISTIPGPAALWVDKPENLHNSFYTDDDLIVISSGHVVSDSQPLDSMSAKRAQRFISVEDEWFQSLQREISWADRKTPSGKYLYTPVAAPGPERGPLLFGKAIEAWTFNFVWFAIAICLTVAATTLCLVRNKPGKMPPRSECDRCRRETVQRNQRAVQNEAVQSQPALGRQDPTELPIRQGFARNSNTSGTCAQFGVPRGAPTVSADDSLVSQQPQVHAKFIPSPSGQYVTVRLFPVTNADVKLHDRKSGTTDLHDSVPCAGICDPFADANDRVAAQHGLIWPRPPWLASMQEHDISRMSTVGNLQGEQSINSAVSIVPDSTSGVSVATDSATLHSVGGGTTRLMS